MITFTQFLYEFLAQFLTGIINIIKDIIITIPQMFNIPAYVKILSNYKSDFTGPEWVLVVISIFLVLLMVAMTVALIVLIARKYIKIRKKGMNQESLLEEISRLNTRVMKLMKEKDEIMAMKVSQLGLQPGVDPFGDAKAEEDESEEALEDNGQRFPKLADIDFQFRNYKLQNYNNSFTLEELCETFRQFAASRLGLYYTNHMMKLFIAALASTKLVILQGISGTGKTSLAYAWGKFLKHDSCVASVQPSWRDRTELFGYFNEFTKKFNETEVLKEIYLSGYTDDIYTEVTISSSDKIKIKSVIGDTTIKKEGEITEDKQNVIIDNYIYPIIINDNEVILNSVTYSKGE